MSVSLYDTKLFLVCATMVESNIPRCWSIEAILFVFYCCIQETIFNFIGKKHNFRNDFCYQEKEKPKKIEEEEDRVLTKSDEKPEERPNQSRLELEEMFGRVLKRSGVAITVTSLTDFLAFAVGGTTVSSFACLIIF